METRQLLWHVPQWAEVVMYAGAGIVILVVIAYLVRRVLLYRRGRSSAGPRTDSLLTRIGDLLMNGALQKGILRERFAGIMHLGLFWGFMILLAGTTILIFAIDFGLGFFHGDFYLVFSFFMELAGLALIVGTLLAAWRRYVRRPTKLEYHWDDHYALIVLFILGVTGFFLEAIRIYATGFPSYERAASFVGYGLGKGLAGIGSSAAFASAYPTLWIVHMFLTLGFLGVLCYSKFLHVFTAPANILLRERRPKGSMTFVPDIEEAESLGVGTVAAYSWPDLEDLDACMRCGRCQEACPATASGKPLNPKTIVLKSRQALTRKDGLDLHSFLRRDAGSEQTTPDLLDVIADSEIWSCTTCRSCVEHCPVAINQLDKILEIRRYLTNEGRLAGSAAKALESMGMRGNPWQLKQADRLAWAEGLGVDLPILGEIQNPSTPDGGVQPDPVDYLFFVGCAGSYDPRAQKITRALARLLTRAQVSFAVLGTEETCNCEAGRRMGEEMLFQVGAQTLKETIDQYRFRAILTQCPHCYNTFRNDYPQLGADWQVVHHTELLRELVTAGRLKIDGSLTDTMAYHDSCYLGRYNDIYQPPRDLLAAAGGRAPKEAGRRGPDGFCCGGGGGRMWSEVKIGEPIEFLRTRELLQTGARVLATACPFCKIMIDDGVKHEGKEDEVFVRDVAEILEEATARSAELAPANNSIQNEVTPTGT